MPLAQVTYLSSVKTTTIVQDFAEYLSNLQHQIAAVDDQVAYRKLFDLMSKRLISFSCSFVKSPEAAEEIVSDVFIKIWLQRKNLPAIHNIKLYLYTATKNYSLNYLRKQHQQYTFQLDDLQVENDFFVQHQNPEELFITGELRNKIAQSIAALPPKCQLIFRLIKEDGLHYKEVAELLQLSVKTVEAQMGIALKKIAVAIRPNLTSAYFN